MGNTSPKMETTQLLLDPERLKKTQGWWQKKKNKTKTAAAECGNVGMMEMGMCTQSSVAPSQHAPWNSEKTETRFLFFFSFFLIVRVSAKTKKKKTDVRTQNSLCSPNLQTTAISRFQPSSAKNLMRSQSCVCTDHHFYLSQSQTCLI